MEYKFIETKTTTKVKSENVTFLEKIKIDLITGKEIFDPKLEQENDVRLFNEYRKNNNLLRPEKIKEIRNCFNVTQVVFAQVLGLGDKTITRYENGSIQDTAQNNLIKAIGENPILFLENFRTCQKLKKNLGEKKFKEELEKISDRVKALKHFKLKLKKEDYELNNEKFSSENMAEIILNIYPSEELKDFPSHLKLQKLMYFVNSNHIGLFGESLIEEPAEAWVHGPVFKNVYFKYNKYGHDTIPHEYNSNLDLKNESLKKFILKILKGYGNFGAKDLEKLSHDETPWKLARKRANVNNDQPSNEKLRFNEIEDYYKMLLTL